MRKLDKEWTDRVLYPASCVGSFNGTETRGRVLPARDIRAGPKDEKREQEKATVMMLPPNGSRLSCGALKNDSFHNLRAPPASSAC